jgi:hypothetical protein
MFGGSGLRRCNAKHSRWLTFLIISSWASLADARDPVAELSGLVSIADGGPFTIIRRDSLWTGTSGGTLVPGDMVETGPGGFLVIEMQGGSLVGIGPATQVYFLQRAEVATLLVLKGWLKADIRAKTSSGALRVVGTRLGIEGRNAVVLLNATELSDAIFDEQGSATLVMPEDAATRTDRQTKPNQFFVREDGATVILQPHPAALFLANMPIAFRDPLPGQAGAQSQKRPEPTRVRSVTYSDLQPWLTMPAGWRAGFIGRFRGRLNDPAFFSAMDAHLALHPEWVPILHPPVRPPSRDNPHAGTPAAPPSNTH